MFAELIVAVVVVALDRRLLKGPVHAFDLAVRPRIQPRRGNDLRLGSANSRFIGSIAFVAAARAAFIIARDPENSDRRLFLPTKNNLGPEGTGLGFRIGQVVTPTGLLAPSIFWDDLPVTLSADQVLVPSAETATAPARNEAEDFLRIMLAERAVPAKEIKMQAREAGLAWKTVCRAKTALGVKSSKTAMDGGWEWFIPQAAAA